MKVGILVVDLHPSVGVCDECRDEDRDYHGTGATHKWLLVLYAKHIGVRARLR